jgi:hypothetical protein
MDSQRQNNAVIALGCALIPLGIIISFIDGVFFDVVSLVALSIGASLFATGLANRLLNRRVKDVILSSVMSALRAQSELVRYNHRLELRITLHNSEEIMIFGNHRYSYQNPASFPKTRNLVLFTDVGRQGTERKGGYERVRIGKELLEGTKLEKYITEQNNKVYFSKPIKIEKMKPLDLQIETYGLYRLRDRLVWTVSELSEGFDIKVVNETNMSGEIDFKINHHNESLIRDQIEDKSFKFTAREEKAIHFNSEVLPYQGFEMIWSFNNEQMDSVECSITRRGGDTSCPKSSQKLARQSACAVLPQNKKYSKHHSVPQK